jgi:hypothetical protein
MFGFKPKLIGIKPKLMKYRFALTYFYDLLTYLKTIRTEVVMFGIKPKLMKCTFVLAFSKAIPNEKLSVKYHQHPFKASMDNHVCWIIPSEDISDARATGFVPLHKSAI